MSVELLGEIELCGNPVELLGSNEIVIGQRMTDTTVDGGELD